MPRRCRYCRNYNIPKSAPKEDAFCSHEHKVAYAMAVVNKSRLQRAKVEKQKNARQKKDFYVRDIKTRREAATKWFNRYILLRDRDEGCATCGTAKPGLAYHAGHYVNAGGCSALRYDERNVWKQCARCNLFL